MVKNKNYQNIALSILFIIFSAFAIYKMWSVGPCDKPLAFKLVNLDTKFGLTVDETTDMIKRAASIWNLGVGKEIVIYSSEGTIPISFVHKQNYDLFMKNSDSSNIQIEQGNFEKDSIAIYSYQDDGSLIRLIAHEMGHAMGMDHVSNSESIMYYSDKGTGLKLSDEDMKEYKKVCAQ